MAEKRTDPDDDRQYTFEELCEKYAGEFNPEEIQEYWAEDMAPDGADLKSQKSDGLTEAEQDEPEFAQIYQTPDPSEIRIDPENDRSYSFQSFRREKIGDFTEEEIVAYWFDEMVLDLPEGTKVFIGNLGKHVSEEDLCSKCGEVGEVVWCQLMTHPDSQESMGYATVQYKTTQAANEAVTTLKGRELVGQHLDVKLLFDKGKNKAILVACLGKDTTLGQLIEKFLACGEIAHAELIGDQNSGEPKGQAKVDFVFPESVLKAATMFDMQEFNGRRIHVTPWISDERGRRQQGPLCVVQKLNPRTTLSGLKAFFEGTGVMVVDIMIMVDRDTGESRGIGKVEFVSDLEAKKAVEMLNGTKLDGNQILVHEFKPPGGRKKSSASNRAVFVGGLPLDYRVDQLKELFTSAGEVLNAVITTDRKTGKSRGCGKVSFKDEEGQHRAIQNFNGVAFNGRTLAVRPFQVGAPVAASKATIAPAESSSQDKAIFIGGIASSVTVPDLKAHFESCGPVVYANILNDKYTGKSRGLGKIIYASTKGKMAALRNLNGAEFMGKTLVVKDFATGSYFNDSIYGVHVSGMPLGVDREQLRAHFEGCGQIMVAALLTERVTKKARGVGKVVFASEDARARALKELDGSEMEGHIIAVRPFTTSKSVAGDANHDITSELGEIFVGGLSSAITAADLQAHFEKCGEIIHSHIILDKTTGTSRGIGKVVFRSQECKEKAIRQFHETDWDGKKLCVREFGVKPPSSTAASGVNSPSKTTAAVFVARISSGTTAAMLQEHFADCGEIIQAVVFNDKDGNARDIGRVIFATEAEKNTALQERDGSELNGQRIVVRDYMAEKPLTEVRNKTSGSSRLVNAVFVSRLSFGTTAAMLQEHFMHCGEIIQTYVFHDKDGKSRGMGKIEFATEVEKNRAIQQRDGSELDGQSIAVREYMLEKPAATSSSRIANAVFVARLSCSTTAAVLQEHFADCGQIVHASVFYDKDGNSRGVGKVEFARDMEKNRAIEERDGSELDGQSISVREYILDRAGQKSQIAAATTSMDKRNADENAVYVVGLSSETRSEAVEAHFKACSHVVYAYVNTDKESGKSKRSAKVVFVDAEAKAKAFGEMNGSELDGCTITMLDWAPFTPCSTSAPSAATHETSVFIGGLNVTTSVDDLKLHFEDCGKVVSASIMVDKETGNSKGVGRITFATAEAYERAVREWKGSELHGRFISVQPFNLGGPGKAKLVSTAGSVQKEMHAVFVGGLSPETDTEALRAHFMDCGEVVDCRVFIDKDTGKSKCSGKVSFSSDEACMLAVSEWNESELDDRFISVRKFTAPSERLPTENGKSKRHGSNENHDENSVFVKGLHRDTDVEALRVHFEACGEIVSCEVLHDRDTLISKGLAKITFATSSAKFLALEEWNGSQLDFRTIKVLDYIATGKGSRSRSNSRTKAKDSWKDSGRPSNTNAAVQSVGRRADLHAEDFAVPEKRVDPDDACAYTFQEIEERYKGQFSADELKDFWEFDMMPYYTIQSHSANLHQEEKPSCSSSPLWPTQSKKASEVSPVTESPASSSDKNPISCSMTINDWLDAVDEQWLRHLSQTPRRNHPNRGVREFRKFLEEEFDSVDQILQIYGIINSEGAKVLKDEFFVDCGITKIGHKRMLNKWVSENM